MTSLWKKVVIAAAVMTGLLLGWIPCVLHKWGNLALSSKPIRSGTPYYPDITRTYVDRWTWNWMNPIWGNAEDGVSGQSALIWGPALPPHQSYVYYDSTFPSWMPQWCVAYAWSFWRNSAHALKVRYGYE